MKKIMYISFLLFLVILSFQEVTYYSAHCDTFKYNDVQRVKIEKTKKEDNNAFIYNIEKTAKEIGCDIAFFLLTIQMIEEIILFIKQIIPIIFII